MSHHKSEVTPWNSYILPLFLLLFLGTPHSVSLCPAPCLCASDIISCSGLNLTTPPLALPGYTFRLDLTHNSITVILSSWTSQNLSRLSFLVLNHNYISQIQENAFAATPHLTHLDLSSNQLTALHATMFTGLQQLQELLLFGNYISYIQSDAFRGLLRLQRLYLSGNTITEFPIGLFEEQNQPRNLTFLDLSGNRLTQLPVQTLLSLQSWIYLQDNPLICDCPIQGLMEYWEWKQYRPVVDFGAGCKDDGEFVCGQEEEEESMVSSEEQSYQVEPGSGLSVPCPMFDPSVHHEGALVFWVTPHTVLNSSEASNDSTQRFSVLSNGTLQISSSQVEDSGTYGCVVSRGRHFGSDSSLDVTITVGNSSHSSSGTAHRTTEHFNTAFTTLASCVVSIVLVLLYLYLTPCRCSRNGGRGCGGRAIVMCSDPREVEAGPRRANGKRVAFLDPQLEECNNGGPKTTALNIGQAGTDGILKNGSRTLTDSTYVV